jgi:hypothetical protein
MNFRELINKLDHINEAEGLTLQSIAAIEKAAMDKATAEKAKGGWTGFTTWDPRVAGNIALAKLAQQNNFEGLFNSEGDFVVAYGNRTWSSNSELHPGENPRVVPPSPDDWKPLAAKGLVPQNAKGPAGLINWLSSGGAQREFDAVKKQSADAAAGTTAPVDAAQAAKVSSADEEAKMTQLEGLVDQYLKLKEDIKTGVKKSQAAKVTTTDPMDDSDDANAHAFDPTWGGTKATGGQTVAPNAGASWDNAKQMAVPGVVKESALASALVESFGYQKKTSIAELIESFGYRKNHPYSLLEQEADLSLSSRYGNPKDAKSKKDDDDFDPDAYLQSKYGDADDTKSGRVDRRTWKEKNIVTTIPNAIWREGTLTWEDEIIPGVYSFKDLGIDLGIAAGFVLVGTIMAPFTAGASAAVGYAGAGAIFVRWIIRIARGIQSMVKIWGKPYWELVKLNPTKAAEAVSAALKTHADAFWRGLTGNLSKLALLISALISAGFNGAALILKEFLPDTYKAIGKGVDKALDTIQPGIDWARKKTGLEEGLQ